MMSFIGEYKWRYIFSLIGIGVCSGLRVGIFSITYKNIFEFNRDKIVERNIIMLALILIIIALFQCFFNFGFKYCNRHISANIRITTLNKLSIDEFETNHSANILSCLTNDVPALEEVYSAKMSSLINVTIVGIVGESGSGKSTLLKILMSFYDVDSGQIFIDGKEIKTYNLDDLRNKITYVSQDSYLFYGTVKENISYGLSKIEISEEFIIEAAKKASAHDFIMKLPKGYDTMIEERGTNLSGGEKQRIAIARAFLKNAPILLLDEPTSALDKQSEEIVKKSIMKLMENRTVLIVTHKRSTIENADYIYEIDKGNIFGFD